MGTLEHVGPVVGVSSFKAGCEWLSGITVALRTLGAQVLGALAAPVGPLGVRESLADTGTEAFGGVPGRGESLLREGSWCKYMVLIRHFLWGTCGCLELLFKKASGG